MRKKVISDCCSATINHFPTNGLDPMQMVIFFCDKCGKNCKTVVIEEEIKKIK
jgi:hypothetical protein